MVLSLKMARYLLPVPAGVGSIAAMILASMGYRVTASTGRPEEAAWLYKTVGVGDYKSLRACLPWKTVTKRTLGCRH
jgi:NADPH:quinone reductase-like Zn-dependent oxidoreductase